MPPCPSPLMQAGGDHSVGPRVAEPLPLPRQPRVSWLGWPPGRERRRRAGWLPWRVSGGGLPVTAQRGPALPCLAGRPAAASAACRLRQGARMLAPWALFFVQPWPPRALSIPIRRLPSHVDEALANAEGAQAAAAAGLGGRLRCSCAAAPTTPAGPAALAAELARCAPTAALPPPPSSPHQAGGTSPTSSSTT